MTVEIQLHGKHGGTAFVDDKDAGEILKYRWFMAIVKDHRYVRGYVGQKMLWLHRFILNAPAGLVVDHIDGNGLNNVRSNIRLCTIRENACWTAKRKNKHGFRGIVYRKSAWRAHIKVRGKDVWSRNFRSAEDAALAYDDLAKLHHGAFATLNFPQSPATPEV